MASKMMMSSIHLIGVFFAIFFAQPGDAFLRNHVYNATEIAAAANAKLHLHHDRLMASFGANHGADDEALILTPYIEAGKLAEGLRLSQVHGLPGEAFTQKLVSYSGYLTVNKAYNSNLFFWFFPPLSGKVTHDTPIILWLQGGPGSSSLYGLFVENGPLVVMQDRAHVTLRDYTWAKDYAMIFVDQPIGTGFSFTNNDAGYARNQTDVGRDLYEALRQFFTLFEAYRGNPFYISGESYAGKYVPTITRWIVKEGDRARKAGINLAGMIVGDGLCDPRHMFDYGDLLYQIGLLDGKQRDFFLAEQAKAIKQIEAKQFDAAFRTFDLLLNGDLTPNGFSYYRNWTGMTNYFNFLFDDSPADNSYYGDYLALRETRRAIHVGAHTYNNGTIVEEHLMNDVMQSVAPWVTEILDSGVRSLFYSGQLDIIVAAPLTENFLHQLKWKHSKKYVDSDRSIYKVQPGDRRVAGYVREAENLIYALIRNAGHMVPYDQPRVADDMIRRFIEKRGFK